MTLAPAARSCSLMACCAPRPRATLVTSAPTPTPMPTMASTVCRRLRLSAPNVSVRQWRSGIMGGSSVDHAERGCAFDRVSRSVGPVAHDLPVANRDDTRTVAGHIHVVGDEHDSHGALLAQLLQQGHD